MISLAFHNWPRRALKKMIFVVMVAVQSLLTVFFVVVINRKLLLQNIALRNQLGVYLRTIDKNKIKPQIRDRDRKLWLLLRKFLENWSDYLVIVKPETVINWERQRFKRFWVKKTSVRGRVGRPKISDVHIDFIRRISGDHPEMGSQKVADELVTVQGVDGASLTFSNRLSGRVFKDYADFCLIAADHGEIVG